MTVLHEILSLRPMDHLAIRQLVMGPIRSVLATGDAPELPAARLLTPGRERC